MGALHCLESSQQLSKVDIAFTFIFLMRKLRLAQAVQCACGRVGVGGCPKILSFPVLWTAAVMEEQKRGLAGKPLFGVAFKHSLPQSRSDQFPPTRPPTHHQLRAEGTGWTDSVLFHIVLLTIQPKLAKK